MQRWAWIPCIVLSFAAAGLAVYAIGTRSPASTDEPVTSKALREVRQLVQNLQEQVREIDADQERIHDAVDSLSVARRRSTRPESTSDPAAAAELREHIEELTNRLAELENEETIATLARSGEEQLERKQRLAALRDVVDRSMDPAARMEALWSLSKEERRSDEVVEAMRELALDANLDAETRTGAIKALNGVMSAEVRHDMLGILESDGDAEVRRASIVALIWHGADPVVFDTIRLVSQGDRQPSVQQFAGRILPKVEWVADGGGEDK